MEITKNNKIITLTNLDEGGDIPIQWLLKSQKDSKITWRHIMCLELLPQEIMEIIMYQIMQHFFMTNVCVVRPKHTTQVDLTMIRPYMSKFRKSCLGSKALRLFDRVNLHYSYDEKIEERCMGWTQGGNRCKCKGRRVYTESNWTKSIGDHFMKTHGKDYLPRYTRLCKRCLKRYNKGTTGYMRTKYPEISGCVDNDSNAIVDLAQDIAHDWGYFNRHNGYWVYKPHYFEHHHPQ